LVDVGSLLLVMGRENRNNGTIRDEEKEARRNFRGNDLVRRHGVGPGCELILAAKRTNFGQE